MRQKLKKVKAKEEPWFTYYDQNVKAYRATNARYGGIMGTDAARKFTRKNPKGMKEYLVKGIYGDFNWSQLGYIARMYYENVQDAVNVLVRGSTLFKQTPRSTFVICKIIHDEIEKRSKSKRSKADKKYPGINRVIDDKLEELCKHAVELDYRTIFPSKDAMRKDPKGKGKITKTMEFDRQPTINRFIEKYRRLAKNNKKAFKEYLDAKVTR